jgi:hypothetical protein
MERAPLSKVMSVQPPSLPTIIFSGTNTPQRGSTSPVITNLKQPYENIDLNEMSHDIRAIKNNDDALLEYLANKTYNWNRYACLTVLRTNVSVDHKKKMLSLLIKNSAVFSPSAIEFLINDGNIELINHVLHYPSTLALLIRIIELGKIDLLRKMSWKHPFQDILRYAIEWDNFDIVKYAVEELKIKYDIGTTSSLLGEYTYDTQILDCFYQNQPEIFTDKSFWFEVILRQELGILKWGLEHIENFKSNYYNFMTFACETAKVDSIKWLHLNMSNIKQEKIIDTELINENNEKDKADTATTSGKKRKGDELSNEIHKKARMTTPMASEKKKEDDELVDEKDKRDEITPEKEKDNVLINEKDKRDKTTTPEGKKKYMKTYMKTYYQKHEKDYKTKKVCDICDGTYNYSTKYRHLKSKKHIAAFKKNVTVQIVISSSEDNDSDSNYTA